MGDIADGLINGDFDSITGEYLGEGHGYPRTRQEDCGVHYYEDPNDHDPSQYSKGTRAIRKELAILIKKTIKDNPDKSEDIIVNDCRRDINKKYGKGWRNQF